MNQKENQIPKDIKNFSDVLFDKYEERLDNIERSNRENWKVNFIRRTGGLIKIK